MLYTLEHLTSTYYEIPVSHIDVLVERNAVDRGRQRLQVQGEEFRVLRRVDGPGSL